jgi:hypothetical protein
MPDTPAIQALHLFSDKKFIPWVKQTFQVSHWHSHFIIINVKSKNSQVVIDDDTIEVSGDAFGQNLILEKLKGIDIAFHYFLDNIKANIVFQDVSNTLHCWCFYGAEIYQQTSRFRKELYGPVTKQLLWTFPEIKFRYDLRKYFYFLQLKTPPITSLLRAIPKIHNILWYVEEEMNRIKERIPLPAWKFFQFFSFPDIIPTGTGSTNKQNKKILVGNSATIENNHADVLNAIKECTNDQYSYSLPLTYGQFPRYKARIKTLFKRALGERVKFVEDHMALQEYYLFLLRHPTAVFLHYRQQGLGNILYLLYVGTKVYLSRKNVVTEWLTRNQIKVYIFEEEFARDIQQDNLVLDDATASMNRNGIMALLDHNRNEQTLKALEAEVLMNREMNSK